MSGIRKIAADLYARTKQYIKSIGRGKIGGAEGPEIAPGEEGAKVGEAGLRYKLLAILIILTLLPLLAAGYLTLNMITENMDEQTRITVEKDARAAEYIFMHRLEECAFQVGMAANNPKMLRAFEVDDYERVLAALYSDKANYGLDFLTLLDAERFVEVRANSGELQPGSKVDFALLEKGLHGTLSGLTVLPEDFLREEQLLEKAAVRVKDPDGGLGSGDDKEGRAMAFAAVVPIVDQQDGERLEGVLIGGVLLNNNDHFVEGIAQTLGVTTTFFFEDLRVATTVLDERGEKAIGTRAAQNVAHTVLVEEKPYSGRALVVDENYITSYLPLRDHDKEVVGMLYVGIPEAPFIKTKDANRNRFLLIGALSLVIALGVALKFSKGITDPLNMIVNRMRNVAYTGALDQEVKIEREDEIGKIAKGFNIMLGSLKDTLHTMQEMSEKINFSTGELSAAVQQSNAAMEEIALATGDSVAHQAQEIAHVSEQAAAKGKEDEENAS
ncbi:MAG: methyl-accepting chemotaxis protein, partial [Firmicutes bacterium]|nr:methyl-accepting chemotaxis protein [Bacillota bacterium]